MRKRNSYAPKCIPVLTVFALTVTLFPTNCLAEAEAPSLTLEEIVEANITENLLKHYDSFLLEMDEKAGKGSIYIDSELIYTPYSENDLEILSDSFVYGKYDGVYTSNLFVNQEIDTSAYDIVTVAPTTPDLEEITDIKEEGDSLIITAVMSEENWKKCAEEEPDAMIEPPQEGESKKLLYTVDAETFAIQKLEEFIVSSDGTETENGVETVTYGIERPAEAADLYAHATATENTRTVTLITEPDTENEKEYSMKIPKGDRVGLQLPSEDWELYEDRECTTVFSGNSDTSADCTIYATCK